MSNVLIGIIGVILFIGLALAGALILGDDFRSSSNDSKAASVIQQLSQVANAVTMSNLKTGGRVVSGNVDASSPLIPRFLKTSPINTVNRARGFAMAEATGGANGGIATIVVTILGNDGDVTAKAVCEAIQRQTGQIAGDASFDGTIRNAALSSLPTTAGCYYNSVNYTAFVKI